MNEDILFELLVENIQYKLDIWGKSLDREIELLHLTAGFHNYDYRMIEEVSKEIERENLERKKNILKGETKGWNYLYKEWEENV